MKKMKKLSKIFLLAILASVCFSSIQAQELESNIYISKTVQIANVDVVDLHHRANNWLATYFLSHDRTIVSRDIDEEFFNFDVKVPIASKADGLQFNIRIDLANGEYIYKIWNLSIDSTNKKVKKTLDKVVASLEKTLSAEFTDAVRDEIKN